MSIVVLGAACGFLDDRPSQQAAERVHASLRTGMTLGEVVALTEPLVERSVWEMSVQGCAAPGTPFVVRRSDSEGSAYRLLPGGADDPPGREGRTFATAAQLVRALADEPGFQACREYEVGLGQWGVPFHVDPTGRVDAVSRPRFTD